MYMYIYMSALSTLLQPDISRTIRESDLASLSSNVDRCKEIEVFLAATRSACDDFIDKTVGTNVKQQHAAALAEAVARLALARTKTPKFPTSVIGKFTTEKMVQLRVDWLRNMIAKCKSLEELPGIAGIHIYDAVVEELDHGEVAAVG